MAFLKRRVSTYLKRPPISEVQARKPGERKGPSLYTQRLAASEVWHVNQFVITIDQMTARFTSATGVTKTRQTQSYNDGEAGVMRTHLAFVEFGEIEISKPYDPSVDYELIQYVDEIFETSRRVSIAIQSADTSYQGAPIPGS